MTHDRAYFQWLLRRYVLDRQGEPDGYSILLEQMHRKEYYFVVSNDENRAGDGLALRDTYSRTAFGRRNPGTIPEGPCSFLEFMIGVAIRLEEMLVDGEPLPVDPYFWELVSRLGLTEYPNDTYAYDDTTFAVDQIMTNFMDRKYRRSGEGGLFPLRRPYKDQTRTEVWYQLNAYLLQNPEFFEE